MLQSKKSVGTRTFVLVCATAVVLPAVAAAGAAHSPGGVSAHPPDVTPCAAVCYSYRQAVRDERREKKAAGFKYFSPLHIENSDEEILRVHIVDRHTYPPVDDSVWVDFNGQKVWRVNYPTRKGDEIVLASALRPGANTFQLWYENSQPPDANFSLSLAGTAYCPSTAVCHNYDEGLSYGTGIVNKIVSGSSGKGQILPEARLWRSEVDLPPAKCKCVDP